MQAVQQTEELVDGPRRIPGLQARLIARGLQAGLRAFFLGANAASLRLWSRPKDAYWYWNACLFLRDSMGKRGLPAKHVWEVFPQAPRDAELRFPELPESWIHGDPSYLSDLIHLGLLCQAVRPRAVFEIGTSTGYSSLFVAANTAPDAKIWTLDLPTADSATSAGDLTLGDRHIVEFCHKKEPVFVAHALGQKIQRVYGDSATFDFSPYRRAIDLFFVDGAHTYDYVRSDTINALKCCRPGGVIAWHDYGRSSLSRGVTKWLDELSGIIPVYAPHGSSLAFAAGDFDCDELVRKLGGRAVPPAEPEFG